jgi:tail protein
MILTLSTYDSTSITSYGARIQGLKPPQLEANIITNERAESPASFGGKSFKPSEFEIIFEISDVPATKSTQVEAIGKLFDPRMKRTLKTLVALDTQDGSAQYYIECTPSVIPKIEGKTMVVKMWAADPVWKKVTASTKTVSVTSSPTNDTVTNNGNVDAYPVITITPTNAGGSYTYRRHIILYNPTSHALPNHPLEITGGGLDFTALTKDTSRSNQINVGGGISAVATTWAIDTAVGGGLPSGGGVFMMESEQCSYTSISGGTTINGVTRGINGTTAATHADNVVMIRSLMKANGDDIRTFERGVEQERWLGGTVYSDTTLKIWNVYDIPAGISMTLKTALGSSNETVIELKNTLANKTAIANMPDSGLLFLDSECIAYTAKNVNKRTFTIANNGRGVKDTTAASHSAGITFYWVPLDIVINYANTSAETPVQTDVRKPVFSLDNSTNTNWRYDSADSVFADLAGLRAGGWKPSKPLGFYSNWYTGNQGTAGVDPVTDMGAEIVSYLSGSLYKPETAAIFWTLNVNTGFDLISAVGEKYRDASTTPFPICDLLSSVDGSVWVREWLESAPTAGSYVAWTHASENVPNNSRYLRFRFRGAVKGKADSVARNEVNLGSAGSMGVTLTSANIPQITVKSQTTNSNVDFVLANNLTGESLEYAFPLKTNTALTIDTKARVVQYEDRYIKPPELNTTRAEWFRLQPGDNPVTYTDASTGNVTVLFTWEQRKNM